MEVACELFDTHQHIRRSCLQIRVITFSVLNASCESQTLANQRAWTCAVGSVDTEVAGAEKGLALPSTLDNSALERFAGLQYFHMCYILWGESPAELYISHLIPRLSKCSQGSLVWRGRRTSQLRTESTEVVSKNEALHL